MKQVAGRELAENPQATIEEVVRVERFACKFCEKAATYRVEVGYRGDDSRGEGAFSYGELQVCGDHLPKVGDRI